MVQFPSRRLFVSGALAAWPAVSAHADCRPPKVLFVCPAGTVKSAIARETLKQRALARSIAVDVRSRGVAPADHVSLALAMKLKADGIDPAAEPAQRFTRADARDADILIAFDEAKNAPGLERARAWATPSWNNDYAAAKADLSGGIDGLLDELAGGGCAQTAR